MTIQQIQQHINDKANDARQLINLIADYLQANPPSPGGLGYLSATVTLTDAQIKTLPTTPVILIVAPGIGKVISPFFYTIYSKCSAGAYTNIDAAGFMEIDTDGGFLSLVAIDDVGSGVSTLSNLLTGGDRILNLLSQDVDFIQGIGVVANNQPASNFNNKAIRLNVNNGGSGNFTGGNAANTLKVTVNYVIVDL